MAGMIIIREICNSCEKERRYGIAVVDLNGVKLTSGECPICHSYNSPGILRFTRFVESMPAMFGSGAFARKLVQNQLEHISENLYYGHSVKEI